MADTPNTPTPAAPTPVVPQSFGRDHQNDADRMIRDSSDAEFSKQFGIEDLLAGRDAPESKPFMPLGIEPDSAAAALESAAEQPRNEDGTFKAETTTDALEGDGAVEAEAPKVEKRKLATTFKVFEGEAEVDHEDLADRMFIEFPVNGVTRKEPLDKVIRWAQFGLPNEQREQAILASKTREAEFTQREQQYQSQLQEFHTLFERAMTDEGFVQKARANYEAMNSPEQRADRAEQQVVAERQRSHAAQQASERIAWGQSYLLPTFRKLAQEHPSVSEDDIAARFLLHSAPYTVSGVIPNDRLAVVQQMVEAELVPWVQATHEGRQQTTVTAKKETAKAVEQERVKLTLAKKQLARAVSPTGGTAPALRQEPKPQVFKSAEDAVANFDPRLPVGTGST